jgi:hypothetical protein
VTASPPGPRRQPTRATSTGRRRTVAALVAAGGLLLSACGSGTPGVAAEVEGDQITDQQVDDFATVLCALGGLPGTEAGTPSKAARFRALEILLANELAFDVADVEGVPRDAYAGAVQQMQASREAVPEEVRDTFDQVAQDFARAQTAIIELGRESLQEQGEQEVSDEAAYAEGERLRAEYAAQADVSVDRRFGVMVDGVLQPSDGSLSVPVSQLAVDGQAQQPTDDLVGALPSSQKCG